MNHVVLLCALLGGCNQWVRPQQEQARPRNSAEQQMAAVKIVTSCENEYEGRAGSGVLVSSWQVVTALHVVDCQSNIPVIHVITQYGRWRMAPEKEWRSADVARIQLFSADSLSPSLAPPALGAKPQYDDLLYMQAAHPQRREEVGVAGGWTYYGKNGGLTGWFAYSVRSEEGNSGSGIYDNDDRLVGIHLGPWGAEKYGALLTSDMVPGN